MTMIVAIHNTDNGDCGKSDYDNENTDYHDFDLDLQPQRRAAEQTYLSHHR